MTYVEPRELSGRTALPEVGVDPVEKCAVCGLQSSVVLAQNMDYELQTCRNTWTFRKCDGCGHIQLNPRPKEEALGTIYPSHYYSYDMAKHVSPVALAGKRMLDRIKFQTFLGFLGSPVQDYLDIGCGDGKYLDEMRRRGVPPDRLFGLELNAAAAAAAQTRGYRVFCERVETTTAIPENALDLITMFHVIEHVADPEMVVRRAGGWLKPGGIFVIETPNTDSLDARLFRKEYWGGYHTPRHWHLFNASNLSAILERNGFLVSEIRYQPGHSFWLFSFHHLLRYNRSLPLPRLARFFNPLKSLPTLIAATAFDLVRSRLGFKTSSMLITARYVGT